MRLWRRANSNGHRGRRSTLGLLAGRTALALAVSAVIVQLVRLRAAGVCRNAIAAWHTPPQIAATLNHLPLVMVATGLASAALVLVILVPTQKSRALAVGLGLFALALGLILV